MIVIYHPVLIDSVTLYLAQVCTLQVHGESRVLSVVLDASDVPLGWPVLGDTMRVGRCPPRTGFARC